MVKMIIMTILNVYLMVILFLFPLITKSEPLKDLKRRYNKSPHDEDNFNKSLNIYYDPDFILKGKAFLGPSFLVSTESQINFKCDNLYKKLLLMSQIIVKWPPNCEEINNNKTLMNKFTMGGKAAAEVKCYGEEKQNGVPQVWFWNEETIKKLQVSDQFPICAYYHSGACEIAATFYNNFIKDKVGVVVGTQNPWAEAGLLKHGAKRIITIEYNPINSSHPNISTKTPIQLADDWLEKKQELVDFAFTYSSLEHDGLGRYGDPVNPFGDLETIARIHCLLKPGGVLFLAFPLGADFVGVNGGRVYGKYRMSLILHFWDVVDLIGNNYFNEETIKNNVGDFVHQPLWILRKTH